MILLILLISLALRSIAINQSFWLDEGINVYYASKLSLVDFITKYPYGDFHPVGYFLMLWPLVHQFGVNEIAIRLLSVLFGVASVWLLFQLAKELFTRKVAIIASLLFAFNPLHIYYSTEARMYALATFAVVLSLLCLVRLVKDMRLSSFLYFCSLVAVLYADYTIYLIMPIQLLFIWLFYKQKLKRVIVLQFLALLCFIPGIFLLIKQLEVGLGASVNNPFWSKVVGSNELKELGLSLVKPLIGRVSLDNKYLYGGISLFLVSTYSFLFIKAFKKTKEMYLLFLWFFLPIGSFYLLSFFIPVFSYFRLLYIIPALCLISACGITNLPKRFAGVTLACLIIFSITALATYYLNPSLQRENWKLAVPSVEVLAKPSANIIFEDTNIPAPFALYSDDAGNAYPGLLRVPATSLADIRIDGISQSKIFLFEYLIDINDPNRLLEAKIKSLGYFEKETLNFDGVGLVRVYEHE